MTCFTNAAVAVLHLRYESSSQIPAQKIACHSVALTITSDFSGVPILLSHWLISVCQVKGSHKPIYADARWLARVSLSANTAAEPYRPTQTLTTPDSVRLELVVYRALAHR